MSGFGDKRRPRDTGKQQDTGQSSSSSGMSRLEQHRSRAAQFTHL
jgi:hypothetical protein